MTFRWLAGAALVLAPAALQAQGAPSLEARVQRVEDELAITRLIVDYAAFLDGRDYARYAELFAADGEWTNAAGTHVGPAAIRAMLERTLGPAGQPNAANYHLVSNPRIDITGDRATATSRYLFVMRGPDGSPTPALAGIYRDEFVREAGRWKIRRRVADDIMPTPGEWRRIIARRQASQ